jgi:hypothetical protein
LRNIQKDHAHHTKKGSGPDSEAFISFDGFNFGIIQKKEFAIGIYFPDRQ